MTDRRYPPTDCEKTCDVMWHDHCFTALASRGLFHRASRTLLVADLHLGKAMSFRQAGIPVPHGTTQATLDRLSEAILACGPTDLIILGDLLHARTGISEDLWSALRRWRAAHSSLRITLVIGNHDRHAGLPPADLEMNVVDEPHAFLDLGVAHDVASIEDRETPLIGGHVHPVIVLRDVDGTRLRSPCFLFGRDCILPAMGAFTGGSVIRPEPGDEVVVVGPGRVVHLGSARRDSRSRTPGHRDA